MKRRCSGILGLLVVGVACGQEGAGKEGPGAPVEMAPLGVNAVSGDGAGPSLPPAACIPFEGERLAEERACKVSGYDAHGALLHTQRLNERGNLIEERRFGPEGHQTSLTTLQWEDGREVFRLAKQSDGSWVQTLQAWKDGRLIFQRTSNSQGSWSETTQFWSGEQENYWRSANSGGTWEERLWTFLAPGKPEHMESRSSHAASILTQYIYDAAGRLARVESPRNVLVYTHDEQGRVSLIDDSSGTQKRYTYHPNGRVQRYTLEWTDLSDMREAQEYDADGRPLLKESCRLGDCDSTRWIYRPDGRITREEHVTQSRFTQGTELKTFQYDAEGRLLVEWRKWEQVNDYPPEPVITGGTHTERRTYLCGTDRLLLVERDSNEDGSVDGTTTYERDALGRLIRTLTSNPQTTPGEAVRTEYEYDCD